MMDSAAWDKAEHQFRTMETPSAIAGIVRCLRVVAGDVESAFARSDARLDALEDRLADNVDKEAVAIRMHALELARKYVSELPSEQENSRGYRDKAMRAEERVTEELRVARYLLEKK